MTDIENPYRVRLVDSSGNVSGRYKRVVFSVTPDLMETRTVNYRNIDPIHAPGSIMAYANTASRMFNISSIRLISRTVKEANQNLRDLWLLRSWTLPRFGRTTVSDTQRENRDWLETIRGSGSSTELNLAEQERDVIYQETNVERDGDPFGAELRGSPPKVLLLSAYSAEGRNVAQHINRVPVVIQNLNIPYPSDVDYIHTSTNVPMPTIMTIDLSLQETHSVNEYERFDLNSFRKGTLRGF